MNHARSSDGGVCLLGIESVLFGVPLSDGHGLSLWFWEGAVLKLSRGVKLKFEFHGGKVSLIRISRTSAYFQNTFSMLRKESSDDDPRRLATSQIP